MGPPETSRAQRWRWTRRGLLVGAAGAAGVFATLKSRPPDPEPDLHLLYTPAAMHHGLNRNPIIVIPGLLGSRLRDQSSGEIVWGAFEGTAADPGTATGARLVALPFTDMMQTPGGAVSADGVLDRVRIRVAILGTFASVYQLLPRSRSHPVLAGGGGEWAGGLQHPAFVLTWPRSCPMRPNAGDLRWPCKSGC